MSGQGQGLNGIVDFGCLPKEGFARHYLPSKSLKTLAKQHANANIHLSVNFQLTFDPLSWHVNLFAFAGQSEWESVLELESVSESRIAIKSLAVTTPKNKRSKA